MSVADLPVKPRTPHPYLDSSALRETIKTLSPETRHHVCSALASRKLVGYTADRPTQQLVASLIFHDLHPAKTAQTLQKVAESRAANPLPGVKPASPEEVLKILAWVAEEESLDSDDDANYA